ncbi:transposase [Massilia antarctica]|uniref:Transposase n=1 Tax=Massilia antarctica TaxID=2765360 RepID=A0AA48W9M8_9BURK|nr:transposase [Massilia antarctica]
MKVTQQWTEQELGARDLGDASLDKKAKKLMERLAADPTASIPEACDTWSETCAAYRWHHRVSLSTWGATIGVRPSAEKNGEELDFPSNLPFNMNGITVRKALKSNLLGVPTGGVPCAYRPIMRLRTGPSNSSSFCALPRAVYTQRKKPAHGAPGRVLAMGVLQHVVEKRKVPLGDRRVHFRCSWPRRNSTSAGYAGITSVPPLASSRSSRFR